MGIEWARASVRPCVAGEALDQADGASGGHLTNIFANIVTVKSMRASADGEDVNDTVVNA